MQWLCLFHRQKRFQEIGSVLIIIANILCKVEVALFMFSENIIPPFADASLITIDLVGMILGPFSEGNKDSVDIPLGIGQTYVVLYVIFALVLIVQFAAEWFYQRMLVFVCGEGVVVRHGVLVFRCKDSVFFINLKIIIGKNYILRAKFCVF